MFSVNIVTQNDKNYYQVSIIKENANKTVRRGKFFLTEGNSRM